MRQEFLDQCEGLYVPRGAVPYHPAPAEDAVPETA